MGNRWSSGWETVICHPSPTFLLNQLSEAELSVDGVQFLDDVTVYLRVSYGDMPAVRQIAEGRGGEIRLCRPYGLRPRLHQLRKRGALLVCLLACAVALAGANLFVWRITVTGNETIPTGAVMRAVTEVGAGIGHFWPGFDSEQLRTELLLRLPEVQWVGVSYRSGVIHVAVRERRKVPEVADLNEPMHIVAKCPGMITKISAKLGQSRVTVGDTVDRGQVLISGGAKSTIGTTRTVHALGTVEGRTWRTISARQPAKTLTKRYTGKKSLKISLILGTKQVNFYRNSSIFGDSCDTITMDYHLCMDGVFAMPVGLVVQRCTYWTAQERQISPEAQAHKAREALLRALEDAVGDEGRIVSTAYATTPGADGMTVTVMAECMEEIGESVPISPEELRQIRRENTLGDETTND